MKFIIEVVVTDRFHCSLTTTGGGLQFCVMCNSYGLSERLVNQWCVISKFCQTVWQWGEKPPNCLVRYFVFRHSHDKHEDIMYFLCLYAPNWIFTALHRGWVAWKDFAWGSFKCQRISHVAWRQMLGLRFWYFLILVRSLQPIWIMMTSSNGNIFLVTGPLCGEFTGLGEFPAQRPVTRSFDVFFDLRLNKRLSKQPWGWWFETPSWLLWRHCNIKDTARCNLRVYYIMSCSDLTWI